MNLENILDMADAIQKQKDLEQELFKEKLKELRKYQEETVLRKDKMNELFPEKLQYLIQKVKGNNFITIECDNEIYFSCRQGKLVFNIRINNRHQVLEIEHNNEYDEIFDWWANEPYRNSHMVRRMKLLNTENEMCSIIENNIECIYKAIAKAVKEYQKEGIEKTTSDLMKLNKVTTKKNKYVKIIIEFEE